MARPSRMQLDRRFSRFHDSSELNRVNASPRGLALVSEEFASMLSRALDAARATGGLVTPAAGGALIAAGYDRDFRRLPLDGVAVEPARARPPGTSPACRGSSRTRCSPRPSSSSGSRTFPLPAAPQALAPGALPDGRGLGARDGARLPGRNRPLRSLVCGDRRGDGLLGGDGAVHALLAASRGRIGFTASSRAHPGGLDVHRSREDPQRRRRRPPRYG